MKGIRPNLVQMALLGFRTNETQALGQPLLIQTPEVA